MKSKMFEHFFKTLIVEVLNEKLTSSSDAVIQLTPLTRSKPSLRALITIPSRFPWIIQTIPSKIFVEREIFCKSLKSREKYPEIFSLIAYAQFICFGWNQRVCKEILSIIKGRESYVRKYTSRHSIRASIDGKSVELLFGVIWVNKNFMSSSGR